MGDVVLLQGDLGMQAITLSSIFIFSIDINYFITI